MIFEVIIRCGAECVGTLKTKPLALAGCAALYLILVGPFGAVVLAFRQHARFLYRLGSGQWMFDHFCSLI